ncbi:hypothetical protein ColTof4_11724 [Colletotrichum tofieldiae]|nr:hypothetical protein ColTof3_03200 [Colletotrichum tofieldiae]GKT79301.1 hypothetical protein ColTof4_11724 [Colletotrichum tofieldiae]GKT82470.1 hypothetical protein Ct61P_00320 [Colletotrichum tofieldiae]
MRRGRDWNWNGMTKVVADGNGANLDSTGTGTDWPLAVPGHSMQKRRRSTQARPASDHLQVRNDQEARYVPTQEGRKARLQLR